MSDLNDRQARAWTALLSGKTITDTARAAGVNEKTIRRWLTDSDEFNMALAAGRREALLGAMNVTTAVALNAAGVVIEVMRNPKTPPGVRLRAELQDFEQRLRKLEGNDATE